MKHDDAQPQHLVVIDAHQRGLLTVLAEVWRYRELFMFLVWRDIKIRYKQSLLGAAWALLKPVISMLVFSVVFGRLARMPSDGIPYPLFVYTALVPWQYFATALNATSQSMVAGANLITRVYFPRLIIPAATGLVSVVDFLVAVVVLSGMMVWYEIAPSWNLLAVPGLVVLTYVLAVGVGMFLTALNVRFRDVKFVITYLIQVWMFATPVVYPLSLVPDRYRSLAALNPMVGVIEGYRWAFLQRPFPTFELSVSVLLALLFLVIGQGYFRRVEQTFADVV